MAQYVVNLNPNFDDLEDFEEEDNNLCRGILLDRRQGKILNPSNYRVQLQLNRDGLLGLGKELIRFAHKYHNGEHHHLMPSKIESFSQTLGIVLTSDSCETIIGCADFDTIDKYLED
jgi:hypothetical protein